MYNINYLAAYIVNFIYLAHFRENFFLLRFSLLDFSSVLYSLVLLLSRFLNLWLLLPKEVLFVFLPEASTETQENYLLRREAPLVFSMWLVDQFDHNLCVNIVHYFFTYLLSNERTLTHSLACARGKKYCKLPPFELLIATFFLLFFLVNCCLSDQVQAN